MKLSDIIASTGVIILLIAFLLNLYKKLPAESKTYSLLNFTGGWDMLFCILSYQILSIYYPGGNLGVCSISIII
jgi:hypothetical protein